MRRLAQTFTPAVSEHLDHVDLLIDGFGGGDPDYPATVSIVETIADVPNGTVLGTVNMASGFVVGWNSIDFSGASITLSAGTRYGIVLKSNEVIGAGDPSDALNVLWDGNPYSGGSLWEGSLVATDPDVWSWELALFVDDPDDPEYSPPGDADGAFRTYMAPEPASLALLSLGALTVLSRRRKK